VLSVKTDEYYIIEGIWRNLTENLQKMGSMRSLKMELSTLNVKLAAELESHNRSGNHVKSKVTVISYVFVLRMKWSITMQCK